MTKDANHEAPPSTPCSRDWPDFPYGGDDPDFRAAETPRSPSRWRVLGNDLARAVRRLAGPGTPPQA